MIHVQLSIFLQGKSLGSTAKRDHHGSLGTMASLLVTEQVSKHFFFFFFFFGGGGGTSQLTAKVS